MPSSLPSSFSHGAQQPAKYSPPPEEKKEERPVQGSALPLIVSVIALALAAAAFFVAYSGERPLTAAQKAEIKGIADDLRSLQNKDLTLTAPFSAKIKVNMSYPTKDLFPDQFTIPLKFEIPLDTQLYGISPTGQTVAFKVQESVPVNVDIPVASDKAFGTSTIKIEGDLPVQTELSSTIKIRSAYRQDVNDIIDRLDKLAGSSQAS